MSQVSLYVWNAEFSEKVPVYVAQAGDVDFKATATGKQTGNPLQRKKCRTK